MATRKGTSTTDGEKKVENDGKTPVKKSTAKDSSTGKSDSKGTRSQSAASTRSAKTRGRAARAGAAKGATKLGDAPGGKKSADESASTRSPAEPSKIRSTEAETPAIESSGPVTEPSGVDGSSAFGSSEPEFPPSASLLSPPPVNAEESKSLVSYLALWGPLIIVGFLVLVFHGDQPEPEPVASGALSDPEREQAMAFVESSPPSFVDEGLMPPLSHQDPVENAVAPMPEPRLPPDFSGTIPSSPIATGYEPPKGYPPPSGPYDNPWGSQRHDPWRSREDRHVGDRRFEKGSPDDPSMGEGEDGFRSPLPVSPREPS